MSTESTLGYEAAIVGTDLLESRQKVFKVYFLENSAANKPWKKGELPAMKKGLARSRYLKGIGTVVSFSDRKTGTSKVFYYNPKMHFLINGPLCVQNKTLKAYDAYPTIDSIIVERQRVPEMTCLAEIGIANFDQTLLCKEGLEAFKEEWCDKNIFRFDENKI